MRDKTEYLHFLNATFKVKKLSLIHISEPTRLLSIEDGLLS